MRNLFWFIFILVACVICTAAAPEFGLPAWVGYLIGINLVTLILYAVDKFAAGRGLWRIPELFLHGVTLAGGTPLAFLSQKALHHKTIKPAFQRLFWIIVGVQIVFLVGWLGYQLFGG
ncbi:MAG: DUF1294 domain-containing protein [Opitutales bacterium]